MKAIILLGLLATITFAAAYSFEDEPIDTQDGHDEFPEDEDHFDEEEVPLTRAGMCGKKPCKPGMVCKNRCTYKCMTMPACDECTNQGDNYDNDEGDPCHNSCNCRKDLKCDFTGDSMDTTKRCRQRTDAERLPLSNPKCAN